MDSRTAPANFWTFLGTSLSVHECSQALGDTSGISENAWARRRGCHEGARVSAAPLASPWGRRLAPAAHPRPWDGPPVTCWIWLGGGAGHIAHSLHFRSLLRLSFGISHRPFWRWVMGLSVERTFCQHRRLRRLPHGVDVTYSLHLWGCGQNSDTPGKVHLTSYYSYLTMT